MEKRRKLQWLVLIAAIIIFVGIVFVILHQVEMQALRQPPVKEVDEQHPNVSVETVEAGSYAAQIIAYGAAQPHFKLTLTAQVPGQVVSLANDLEPGVRLQQGQPLAKVEDSDYTAAVFAAQKDLSDARLNLLEEQRQVAQAETEWLTSGLEGEPDSDLVLRKPQLAVAETNLSKAESALASALIDLQQTQITAPFDALVVERQVSPGSYLQAGGEVATLYSTDRVEIAVTLSARDWAKLPSSDELANGQWPVALNNVENGQSWSGRVLRTEQHLDGTTRKRTLVIVVDQPLDLEQPLLPGTFVQARIGGREMDRIWKLPSSALSQKGEIWYVTADHGLASVTVDTSFSDENSIYIVAPETLADTPQKVLLQPLSSYLQGMIVNPVEEVGHE